MQPNFLALAAAALIPLLVGLIWYSPLIAGRIVSASNLTDGPRTPTRNALRILLFLLLGVVLVGAMIPVTIHQSHLYSLLADLPKPEQESISADLMAKYGSAFRTFKHGAFHGTLTAIFMALPILGISAMAERKRGKVVLAHLGYWIITLALVGGVVCGFGFA